MTSKWTMNMTPYWMYIEFRLSQTRIPSSPDSCRVCTLGSHVINIFMIWNLQKAWHWTSYAVYTIYCGIFAYDRLNIWGTVGDHRLRQHRIGHGNIAKQRCSNQRSKHPTSCYIRAMLDYFCKLSDFVKHAQDDTRMPPKTKGRSKETRGMDKPDWVCFALVMARH